MNLDDIAARLEQRFAQLSAVEQEDVLRILRLAISSDCRGTSQTSELQLLIRQLDSSQLEAVEYIIDQQQKKRL